MRTIRILAAAAALMTLFSAPVAAATRSSFTGAWESIDTDGSYQLMMINGSAPGGHAQLSLFDSFGTICVTVGATSTTFHGLAEGTIEGNTLSFIWRHVGCGNVEAFYELGGGELQYDPTADVVTDRSGVIWTRTSAR